MQKPAVLILTPDAHEYLLLLQDLIQAGTSLCVAETADDARNVYAGESIILGTPDLVAEVIGQMPQVRWVQSSWAGVTPLLSAGRTDYLLTGIKDTFGREMAEYVLGYMLARELKLFERLGRQARRSWWAEHSGTLHGKTLGIMGTGSIGRSFARMAKPFGMRVIGFSRSGAAAEGFEQVFSSRERDEFLAQPDYLVCVLPDTPATLHLLDTEAFRLVQRHCYLVNVGRGSVVDENALVRALFNGELAGATLDVFQQEPLPEDSPLWNAPGLIVTGHISGASRPHDITSIFRENYHRYCENEPLSYQIDFERGY